MMGSPDSDQARRNVEEVVQSSIDNDDIVPLLRLVFEPSSGAAPSGSSSSVELVQQCLAALAQQQEQVIQEVCRDHAGDMAACVGQLHGMHQEAQQLWAAGAAGHDVLQRGSAELLRHAEQLHGLAGMQRNLQQALAAIGAASDLLRLCTHAGSLLQQRRLLDALLVVDAIRARQAQQQQVLAGTGGLAVPNPKPWAGSPAAAADMKADVGASAAGGGAAAAGAAAAAAAAGSLSAFIDSLVAQLMVAVEHLALQEFNGWLVLARARAGVVGMEAIREAAAALQQEEDLAAERRALAAAMLDGGSSSIADVARHTLASPLRRALLAEHQQELQLADAAAAAQRREEGKGSSFALLAPPTPPHPGQPLLALRAVLSRRQAATSNNSSALAVGGQASGAAIVAAAAAAASTGEEGALPAEAMRRLHRALHLHAAQGKLQRFREHYLQQRALQVAADLRVSVNFLHGYQGYLAQLLGAMVIERQVQESTEPQLLGGEQAAALWQGALGALLPVLSSALEWRLPSPEAMLVVKEFLLIMCSALTRYGYSPLALLEMLAGSAARHHELLLERLAAQAAAALAADPLQPLHIKTPAELRNSVTKFGLPLQLAGDAPPVAVAPTPPFLAPFSASVPALLQLLRHHISDCGLYLSGLCGSSLAQLEQLRFCQDTACCRVVPEAVTARAAALTAEQPEAVAQCMQLVANVACIMHGLPLLEAHTVVSAATPGSSSRQQEVAEAGGSSSARQSLASLQDGLMERLLTLLAAHAEAIVAAAAAAADWQPPSPPPRNDATGIFEQQLLVFLQKASDRASQLLPPGCRAAVLPAAIEAAAAAMLHLFTAKPPQPCISGYNRHAIQRWQIDLQALREFTTEQGLAAQIPSSLQAALQFTQLLLEEDGLPPDLAEQDASGRFPLLKPAFLTPALARLKSAAGNQGAATATPSRGRSTPGHKSSDEAPASARKPSGGLFQRLSSTRGT